MELLLKKPNDDFSILEEQMGAIFSTYAHALDASPQLVSGNHLLENMPFPR